VDYKTPTQKRTINDSMMALLLESGRLKDEHQPKHQERRRYKRVPCSLPVEFVYKEWSYKATISDISLSGIFIQTENPFSVGDEVDIAFYSQTLEKGCRIPGEVVRRAPNGIGVELKPIGINQMAILRTIINEVAESRPK
jgi:Tfp pilus assembly protein PilZ